MLRRSILLAWLVAILGIIVPCVASAATTASLETRVRDFELVVPTIIGRSTARTPEKHREKSNAYDEIASGSPLAAEAGVAEASQGIRVTQKGLDIAESHLAQFGEHAPNRRCSIGWGVRWERAWRVPMPISISTKFPSPR